MPRAYASLHVTLFRLFSHVCPVAIPPLDALQHSQDASNRMFVVWVLRKTNTPPTTGMDSLPWPTLKACMYKKR